MSDWLPDLVTLQDHGGIWDKYLEAIYEGFCTDFVKDLPSFRGRKLALKRHPLTQNKEATFWHMITEGPDEAERTPDIRRCERIRWPRRFIEVVDEKGLKCWIAEKKNDQRIHIWLDTDTESYIVVLSERKTYLLMWTAYPVTYAHTRRKLQREYENFIEEQKKG